MPDLAQTLLQVRAAKAGDRVALEALFMRFLPWVTEVVALRLGRSLRQRHELEDVVQESLLDAFRDIDRFQERSEGTFRNWLARIVENNVRDQDRRRRAQKRGSGRVRSFRDLLASTASERFVAADPRPSQHAQGQELAERIDAALLALTDNHRELIILHDRCGMSYGEVAQELGLKNGDTARALHHRALKRLVTLLEPGGPGSAG